MIVFSGLGVATAYPSSASTTLGCSVSGSYSAANVYLSSPVLPYEITAYVTTTGCTAGQITLEAVPANGTPGSCDEDFPQPFFADASGCTSFGPAGVLLGPSSIKMIATFVGVGSTGASVVQTSQCTVFVGPGGYGSCAF